MSSDTITETRAIKLGSFAGVRERGRVAEERVTPPEGIATIADLVRWLKGRDEGYEAAFANEAIVRAAIDHEHVKPDAPIAGASEIAFFPPMTGG